jgi:hypothetical protein
VLRLGLLTGELDAFPFILARDLGMRLSDVRAMPNSEYAEWAAFYHVERRVKKIWRA